MNKDKKIEIKIMLITMYKNDIPLIFKIFDKNFFTIDEEDEITNELKDSPN